ncbi:AIR carboxylase family protein [Candidatus Peregrinibacteria bacterium]|nr:AIR carboxylase family protein [Candidatus Peregrinibacteria bacterium]
MLIPILLGSESDKEFAAKIARILDEFKAPYEIIVVSAHKVPEKVFKLVQKLNKSSEPICYITIAGRSNGLSGVVAGSSIHPVIACPPFNSKEDYLINIHSTLQMPSDTPVLTVIDPKNAALAALRILSLKNPNLKKKLEERIKKIKNSFNIKKIC